MLDVRRTVQTVPVSRYHVSLAVDDAEIREAQRLRYKVFAEEMGARLSTLQPGHDIDLFDPYCDHLLVRELRSGEVVGTYRILSPESARRVGSYYSEQEFDLTRLNGLRPRMTELGRSCVHPDHRSGAVIARLWMGLADYMTRHGHETIIGCASIAMHDGGHVAARLFRQLAVHHLAPVEWHVTPRCRLPVESLDDGLDAPLPPLIKGYTRLGAVICGEPAWDPDFNTADLLMLLPMSRLNRGYARRLLG
ncbi:MAG: GNAT family N-acetyltransferase [Thiobacillus sp. 65-69]|nr:GNAT family N-acetyltransferase [Thiobacillus sp.]ODU90671.1 MAG: GNAT family N-acetyltransferase [Thiobacillus sp. SCN 65-179]OJW35900.1 MAG: GNAT family N-acetyltransferase [Thiobacillus sp. 65-69]